MANVINLLDNERLQYTGFFELEATYTHALNWLLWRKFEVSEKSYIIREKPSGKELFIEWEATKNVDEYSQIKIKTRWELFGVTDVEAKKEGKPKKMQKGEINCYVSADLITDRQEFWAKNVWLSFFRNFYDRYIYRNTISQLKEEISRIGWEYFNEIKAFLQTYRYVA
ncbi:MAG: hypothetical protein QW625_00375 [Candidatus Nanoarchaeia archaeon]